MPNAGITGWGKCLPPAVLTNADLATFLSTSDEWITTRTGIRERRVAHCSLQDMTEVAAKRALACAGVEGRDIDLIVFGTTTFDDQCPNMASGLQARIGADGCGAMDVNTACTSFLYSLSTATAMIRTGVVRRALVVGAELISPLMHWDDRNVAVLFGDGAAAVVVEATDAEEGLLLEKLGCYGDAREILRLHGLGSAYTHQGRQYGVTEWQFEGQEIFKKAVGGMSLACEDVLRRAGKTAADVDLVVPHQANLRIIEAVAKRASVPMDRVIVNVERYGNMSAATVPVALCEALEQGRVKPGALLLMPAFGGGLTFCAHLVRWGQRVAPKAASNAGGSRRLPNLRSRSSSAIACRARRLSPDMLEVFLTALVTFFVVIDPPGVVPMFATLTQDMPPAWRARMAWKSVAIATLILLGFALGGEWVLANLHVSLDAFRIAGGLLLFLIALDMLFETRSQRRQARNARVLEERRAHPGEHEDISVFPLAIPLIAGPGSIASIMLLFAQHADWAARGVILAGVAVNLVLTLAVFLIAARVSQLMSATLAAIVTKVFGILLAALAAQFVVDGIKGAFGLA